MSEAPVPTRIPAQVWNEVNVKTMDGVLTPHPQTNAYIWTAINEVVFRLVRAGIIVDPADADHAVAAEREAIATWLDSEAAYEFKHATARDTARKTQACRNRAHGYEQAAQAIRNGLHHKERP